MKIETLDHVALWVGDRDRLADFLTRHVGMHVIDRTESFTLVGSDARRGKLTLFAAEGEREPGVLARVVLRVLDLDRALRALPADLPTAREDGLATFEAPERLGLGLIQAARGVDYDIDHVVLRVREPATSFEELAQLGFAAKGNRLSVDGAYLKLERGDPGAPERPLLNHIALRVDSTDEHIRQAEARGLDIDQVVDAPNTYALFVWGPDRIKLEYVEHKAGFSLV